MNNTNDPGRSRQQHYQQQVGQQNAGMNPAAAMAADPMFNGQDKPAYPMVDPMAAGSGILWSQPAPSIQQQALTPTQLLLQGDYLDRIDRIGTLMCSGSCSVPDHLRGKDRKADCVAIVMQALRWNMDPWAVALKTFFVGGKISYEAQLVIAVINQSGMLADRLNWEWFGPWEKIVGKFKTVESKDKKDEKTSQPKVFIVPNWRVEDEQGLGVRAMATLRGERHPRVLELLLAQARTRNSTLWTEDPKQQLAYLAGKRWSRLHTPEAILGIYTPDELKGDLDSDMEGTIACPPMLLAKAENAADAGTDAYAEFWRHLSHLERAQLDDLSGQHEELKERARRVSEKKGPRQAAKPAPTQAAAATQAPAATPAPSPEPVNDPAAPGDFQVTFANIADMFVKAGNRMAVEIAAEWITDIEDAEQQKELRTMADQYRAKFPEGGA